jgi:hypothetical protein
MDPSTELWAQHDGEIKRLWTSLGFVRDRLDDIEDRVDVLWRRSAYTEDNRATLRIPTNTVAEAVDAAERQHERAELEILRERVGNVRFYIGQMHRRWTIVTIGAIIGAIGGTLALRAAFDVLLSAPR